MAATRVERSVTLPPDPSSPAVARQLLREVLMECGRDHWRDAAELALSELTTNSVLHAHSEMIVRIRCGPDALRVEVEDASQTIPQQRAHGRTSTTGRGLALVAAVTDEHGFSRTTGGKVVWFALGVDPVEAAEPDVDALLDAWGDDEPLQPTVDPVDTRYVTLAGFPPTLWLAAVEVHDASLREMALYRAGRDVPTSDLAAADRARYAIRAALDPALADERSRAQARSALPAGHPSPLPELPLVLDLEVPVTADLAADVAVLQDVLDEANDLARHGRLLTHPALPEIIALRDWAAEQIISWRSGQAAMPWPGTDAEHFVQHCDDAARETDYDVRSVIDGPRTAIVIDSGNRVLGISQTLAAQIGWEADDLVGRRLVAIVPPRFREAHVAGFTRHLSTGQAHVLRVGLQLPVLRPDGSELRCDFWIDGDRSRSGQAVYIAYVSPAQPTPADG